MGKHDDKPELKFLANTLHEIRTPIQTIVGTTELLSDTHLDNEQTEYVRQIQFSSDVLLSLANDILDITKMGSENFTLEAIPFDLVSLIEQVIDLVSIEAFNNGLEIVTDIDRNIPPNVVGDPTRIQQILLNLIKNSVKFTEKGYIRVVAFRKNDFIFFKVIDSGIGIPEEKRKNLFTDFYQTDTSTARKYGGSGLGLSISKKLVSLMHGSIGVSPNKYGGSVFWFKLPLTESVSFPEETDRPRIPRNTKILIVDDSPLASKSLQYKLQTVGISDIMTATNGYDALLTMEYAAKIGTPFTIAFIDMIMPFMDGWRLASDITANKLINGIKLFLMVPEGQMGAEAKMKILNWFNGYLYKPIKRKKLYDILNTAFQEPLELESIDESSRTMQSRTPQLPGKEYSNDLIAANFKIIVAEDHPINRKILVSFLKKLGGNPLQAENGAEAVKLAAENSDINFIFMDIQMPVMDGLEAAQRIRKNGFNGIIIACTANSDTSDFRDYKKIGINDVIVKPFKSHAVKNILEKWNTVFQLPAAKKIATIL